MLDATNDILYPVCSLSNASIRGCPSHHSQIPGGPSTLPHWHVMSRLEARKPQAPLLVSAAICKQRQHVSYSELGVFICHVR